MCVSVVVALTGWWIDLSSVVVVVLCVERAGFSSTVVQAEIENNAAAQRPSWISLFICFRFSLPAESPPGSGPADTLFASQ